MKTLHLIRHAKSSWHDSALSDIERPLNKRGYKDCKVIGGALVAAGCCFEQVFCSSAQRAQLTITSINQAIEAQNIHWQVDDALYTFSAEHVIRWCHGLEDEVNDVVIVGHNPAMTELINQLSSNFIASLPTCGYAQLRCGINRWRELGSNCGELTQLLTPKMLK